MTTNDTTVDVAAKVAELRSKAAEALMNDDDAAAGKLMAEIRKLQGDVRAAEEKAQEGERTVFAEAMTAALNGVTLPKGLSLKVGVRKTDTGFDDLTAAVTLEGLMDTVHEAIEATLGSAPSTVNGFTFDSALKADERFAFTGRRASSGGGGGGGGGNHFWQLEGQEPVKLDAAWKAVGGDPDTAEIKLKDGSMIPFKDGSGSQQWATKKAAVVAAGYKDVVVEKPAE